MKVENLLNGCWDMHLHGSPSVVERQDTEKTIIEMSKYGYKGFVLKEHYLPTAQAAILFNKYLAEYGVKVLSCIVLNNSVGGINMYAVDAAYNMGTRIISLPTISARKHVEFVTGSFAGKGNIVYAESDNPIYILDENNRLKGEVKELIEYVADRPDIILYTGHVSAKEAEIFLEECAKKGIENLYANHPHWEVGATLEQMLYWSELGAFIEINHSVFKELAKNMDTSISIVEEMLNVLPIDSVIATSDLGQIFNDRPVVGMIKFLKYMADNFGVTEEHLAKMIRTNPQRLLKNSI